HGVGTSATVRGSMTRTGLPIADCPAYKKSEGVLSSLRVDGYWENTSHVVEFAGGTIVNVHLEGLHRNAGGGGALDIGAGVQFTHSPHTTLMAATAKPGSGTAPNDIGSGSYAEPLVVLFDRFTGSSGALSAHTADSGHTWSDPAPQFNLNGSGSIYSLF